MNLASRICNAADPGQILASDVVGELGTESGFSFVEVERRELRGFSSPVHVFQLLGKSAQPPDRSREHLPTATAGVRPTLLARARKLLRRRPT